MNRRVKFLLASAHSTTHDLFKAGGSQFRPKLVAIIRCGQRGNQTIQKIQVCSKVVGSIPLDAANVRSSRDRGPRGREVSLAVRTSIHRAFSGEWVVRLRVCFGERNHIEMVKEDPEDFFGHIGSLLAPHPVRS
jgi:hypothetical protein